MSKSLPYSGLGPIRVNRPASFLDGAVVFFLTGRRIFRASGALPSGKLWMSVMRDLPALDYLQYQYRADLQVLVARWLRQPTDDELHDGYHRLLAVAAGHDARLWLIDTRRRDHSNQQSTSWMVEHFLPLLPQHFNGSVYLAFLFMPTHLYAIERDAAVPPLTYFDGRSYHVQRFTEEQSAMQWLEACGSLTTGPAA